MSTETAVLTDFAGTRSTEVHGCGATACCDPRTPCHRFIFLGFLCFLSFGVYFCYDNPAALQETILADMSINKESFMNLYAWYSWPSVIMAMSGGFLIDRVFGVRLSAIIFASFITLGQVIFGLGAYLQKFWVMEAGRCVFGLGGETLAVAQNTYAAAWFKDKELNMVFGLQLSMARIGSTVNMNIMQPVYQRFARVYKEPYGDGYKTLGYALFFGVIFCLFSLSISLTLAFLDKRANRILRRDDAKTGEIIRLKDIKEFPFSCWLIFIICVMYYVSVFSFIDLGLVFFMSKYGFTHSQASVCNSLVYLISAAASPFFGFIVDRTGRSLYWLMFSIMMTLLSHALLALTFITPFVAMSIMGVFYSLLACSLWPLIPNEVPAHQTGTAYGLMQSLQNLGLGVCAIAAGKIVDNSGYLMLEVFFCICLCVAMLAAVALYFWDSAKGRGLNLSAKEKKKAKAKEIAEKQKAVNDSASYEQKPLITN
ncbi:major facilitator superfamily domain-containing protein 1-like [Rhopilema esculentum]|uniref:major facilitator superfamily domain-containing protein 1-like n=1 Tax=Rhopilema esculentum TaxID=499914 RepID=UPI0031DD6BA5|eukprot:gene4146-20328_t